MTWIDLVVRRALRGRRARRDERGAAALEFGLVSVPLLVMLVGMMQYGLFFNDSLNLRQGVREAARMGVVTTFPTCAGAGTDVDRLACLTEAQVGAITGTTYVAVSAPQGWQRGKPLVVCGAVDSDGGVGLLPLPNGGLLVSTTQMSIEQDDPPPTGTFPRRDALPGGAAWPSGC